MWKVILPISLLVFLVIEVRGVEINEIMKKAHLASYYAGEDGSAQILMKVYSKDKSKKPIKKMFYMLRKDITDGGEQLFFTYFTRPSDIKRTTFLVHKYIDKDDYRRLYIPASDKVLAISGRRKQDPFMGSDFSYEDVSGRHFSKDKHKLIGNENIDGKNCFVTESTPIKKEARLGKLKAWIDQKNFIPIKVQYFDHDNKMYREYRSDSVKAIGGFITIMKRTMVSPLLGTKTEMLINPKKVSYNIGMKEEDFTERSLKKAPVKYFK